MTNCIAFHSYKGGTGKSTISSNLAALMATQGFSVVLLDLDVYAPSLQTYFNTRPRKWINDFLFDQADLDEVIIDSNSILINFLKENGNADNKTISNLDKGKFYVGFSSTSKEDIYKLDGFARQETSKVQLLRKFIMMREEISEQYDPDYIIIDTSPGIRYWSINALAVANAILLSLKMDGIDIEGTRILSKEIYSSFAKLGTQAYLLLNRIAGYCHPPTLLPQNENKSNETYSSTSTNTLYSNILNEQSSTITKLKEDMSMDVISSIPCYCDIQFDSREFLTSLKYPQHPFTQQLLDLITELEKLFK